MNDWERSYLEAKRLHVEPMLADVEAHRAEIAAYAQKLVESFISARAALHERMQREQNKRAGTIDRHQKIVWWNLHPYLRTQEDFLDLGWRQVRSVNGNPSYEYLPCKKGKCDGRVLRSLASDDRELVRQYELLARAVRKRWSLVAKMKETLLGLIRDPEPIEGETA